MNGINTINTDEAITIAKAPNYGFRKRTHTIHVRVWQYASITVLPGNDTCSATIVSPLADTADDDDGKRATAINDACTIVR